MHGYHGKLLLVDLTSRSAESKILDEDVLLNFIGGTGLATYLLYNYCPVGVDPLSPGNPLIFATSPLVGSRLTTSSKFAVAAKSPLTGLIGDSLSSSFLATELKNTGHDALIIVGASDFPTLLSITDDQVEFIDATDLLGLNTFETEQAVKDRLGRRYRVACIGPAGENLVKFASISNDGGRQAGRTGPGAVMGSKNLKAIGLRGHSSCSVFAPDALNVVAEDLSRRSLGPATEKYRTIGTVENLSVFDRLGTLPTLNFQQSTFDAVEAISGETFSRSHHVKNAHCANCTIGCEHVMSTTDGTVKGRMEYESAFALGSLVGVMDPNSVIKASVFCDEMGMDTISAGGTIAWAMETAGAGLIDSDLRFGNSDMVLDTLEKISNREGIGDLLADGTRIASETVGGGSGDWAMHVKGLEMPGYEPRSLKTMALALSVSTRGACHNRSSAYEADFSNRVDRLSVDDGRGRIAMEGEDRSAVMDSLIWCKFLRKAFTDFYAESAEIYTNITGMNVTPEMLQEAGERINNVKKLFNIREGWTRADDTLPRRVLTEALPTGIVKGIGLGQDELDVMITSYYEARGWDEDGMIPPEKLHELGIRISENVLAAM